MRGQKNNSKKIIRVSTHEASLRRKIRRHLRELGFHRTQGGGLEINGGGKDVIRALHSSQRQERLAANADFIARRASELLRYFASGHEVNPAAITPVLERVVADTWKADLFRLASLTWSVPVSNGFGRRLRYLVWDAHNEKLIGLIAIGDPVFNLSVRDNFIGWDVHERGARLVNVMDAYVLGALPPYSTLLGGKMVACLVRSRDIYDDFSRIYGGTVGIISGKEKKARLLAVTTASSMGRSSVYNRLKLNGVTYFNSIGYTSGWGHFHIYDPRRLCSAQPPLQTNTLLAQRCRPFLSDPGAERQRSWGAGPLPSSGVQGPAVTPDCFEIGPPHSPNPGRSAI